MLHDLALENHRTATLDFMSPHLITIRTEVLQTVADIPLYEDTALRRYVPLTLREYLTWIDQELVPGRRVEIPIGIADRLCRLLRRAGWDITIGQPSAIPIENFDDHLAPEDNAWHCPEPLRRAYRRVCSLLQVPIELDRCRVVAALRQQYPAVHMLVVVRNNWEAKELATRLQAHMHCPITTDSDSRIHAPWTHVVSVGNFRNGVAPDYGVVVFWDAALVLSEDASDRLNAMYPCIRIGFLHVDERCLNSRDRVIIESHFGPTVYRPGDIAAGTQVGVGWIVSPHRDSGHLRTQLARKRTHIWDNSRRNRLIAEVAVALDRRDQIALERFGLGEAARWLWDDTSLPDLGIAIVVEAVEHGRAIAALLPGWSFQVASEQFDEADEGILTGNVILTLRRCISRHCLVATNAVIYVAGTGNRWIGNLGPQWEGIHGDRMLVVDMIDDFDTGVERDALQRAHDYGIRGWKSLPIDRIVVNQTLPPATNRRQYPSGTSATTADGSGL